MGGSKQEGHYKKQFWQDSVENEPRDLILSEREPELRLCEVVTPAGLEGQTKEDMHSFDMNFLSWFVSFCFP